MDKVNLWLKKTYINKIYIIKLFFIYFVIVFFFSTNWFILYDFEILKDCEFEFFKIYYYNYYLIKLNTHYEKWMSILKYYEIKLTSLYQLFVKALSDWLFKCNIIFLISIKYCCISRTLNLVIFLKDLSLYNKYWDLNCLRLLFILFWAQAGNQVLSR